MIRILLSAVSVMMVSYLLPGVSVTSFWVAFLFSLLLAFLNYTVKPILVILTLPLTVLTLGLFLWVVNTIMVLMAATFINGLTISGFGWGLLFSLVLSITNTFLFDISKL